ncbi:Hypothetical protein BQ3484_140, partial [Cedratvirus A11]
LLSLSLSLFTKDNQEYLCSLLTKPDRRCFVTFVLSLLTKDNLGSKLNRRCFVTFVLSLLTKDNLGTKLVHTFSLLSTKDDLWIRPGSNFTECNPLFPRNLSRQLW